MQITASLNIVFPIRYRDVEKPDPDKPDATISVSEPILWAYHTPLSSAVFEANYRVIAAAKTALYSKGPAYAAENGVRIATFALRDAARKDAEEYDTADTGPALLMEVRRLTTILHPGDTAGFEYAPVDIALQRHVVDEEEWTEAESALVFFTCGYAMALRARRAPLANALALVLQGRITSSSATDFLASLSTSTNGATSEPSTPSLVPS